MIKGVNRQMIEVTDTGNPYFEPGRYWSCVPNAWTSRTDGCMKRLKNCCAHRMATLGCACPNAADGIRRILFAVFSGGTGIALGMFLQAMVSQAG